LKVSDFSISIFPMVVAITAALGINWSFMPIF